MPLKGMTILEGTTISASGGTSKSFSLTGKQVPTGVNVADLSVADFRVRPNVDFRYREPVKTGGGVYSKDKSSVVVRRPKLKADGTVVINLVRIEVEVDPESTAAEKALLWTDGGQICFDADTLSFRTAGGLD